VNAEVLKISGYSAHADQQDLLKFVDGIPKKPEEIRIVHGETSAKTALQRILTAKGHHPVIAGAD
jgi:metallo-beta-lactamase family protein